MANEEWEMSISDWLVDVDNVLYIDAQGKMSINHEPITQEELGQLKEEVRAWKHFRLAKIFNETVRQSAIETAMLHSTNFEHVISGKSMILNLNLLNKIIDRIDTAKL